MPEPSRARIDGETKLMGVIGEQIAYTLSPALHNAAAAKLGLNIAYLPFALPASAVKGFLDAAWAAGAVGFNVTTPFKELVAGLIPGGKLGSVNTLSRGKEWWDGASTDGEGFVRGLTRLEKSFADFREIVVLGSGGATVALLHCLPAAASPTPPRITILRRDPNRDAVLTAAAPGALKLTFADFTPTSLTSVLSGRGADTLLIQATNGPQRGDDLSAFVPALAAFNGVVVDLVYRKPSALYFAAIAKDLEAQDGEPMLIEQARLSQTLWWGRSASYEDMALALRGK